MEGVRRERPGASLATGRGEVAGVLGLSGPGKSPSIRHTRHLIAPASGTIHLRGRDVPCQRRPSLGGTAGSGWMAKDYRALNAA